MSISLKISPNSWAVNMLIDFFINVYWENMYVMTYYKIFLLLKDGSYYTNFDQSDTEGNF